MTNQIRKHVIASIALSIVAAVILAYSQISVTAQSKTPTSTPTPSPAATKLSSPTVPLASTPAIDPDALDLSTATVYKAPNDVIEILLPKSWTAAPSSQPGLYAFYYGTEANPAIIMQLSIGKPQEIAAFIDPTSSSIATTADVIQAFRDTFQPQIPPGSVMSDTVPVKIGKLKGIGFTLHVPGTDQQAVIDLELRAATLPDGKVLFAFARANGEIWANAKPVIEKMYDSLVINAEAIPTSTPTPTPISLELTATSLVGQLSTVQAKIQALTATATLLPTK